MKGPFTGRHFTVIIVAFFAVVVGVNLLMARYATSTFGGVVVNNSYVASQNFNRWLAQAEAANALGWNATAGRLADGRVAIALTGVDPAVATVAALGRHPLGRMDDQALAFDRQNDGRFVSRAPLPDGRWRLRMEVQAQGKTWRKEQDVL